MTIESNADRRTTRWRGAASELKLRITWRFAFIAPGTVTEPSPETVYLDIGGKLVPGVIDHHQGGTKSCSAARLLFERPDFVYDHLVGPWHAALRTRAISGGQGVVDWSPTIVLHRNPDFDAIACALLAMRIVEDGDLPDYARALAEYADIIDQGFEPLTKDESSSKLYPLILMLSNLRASNGDGLPEECLSAFDLRPSTRDRNTVEIGIKLMQAWASEGNPSRGTSLDVDSCHGAKFIATALQADRQKFDALVSEGKIKDLGQILVPGLPGDEIRKAAASAIPTHEECACNKLYLRADGVTGVRTPLTIIHGWSHHGNGETPLWHWIISVDPSRGEGDPYLSLRGLGASLELAEQRKRGAPDKPRQGVTRFSEFPGIADPWYDGRGHDLTIVDSPQSGSRLCFEEVCVVLRSSFWEPEVAAGAMIHFGTQSGQVKKGFVATQRIRLDVLRTKLKVAREKPTSELERLAVVQAEVSLAWGSETVREFAREVVGGDPRCVKLRDGTAYVGPRGVFVNLAAGRPSIPIAPDPANPSVLDPFARLLAILANLHATDDALAERETLGATERRNLGMKHVDAVAAYYRAHGGFQSGEMVELAGQLDRESGITERVKGVSELLKHVDDDEQRKQDARINRLIFVVACFGVLQTFTAFLDYLDGGWEGDGDNGWQIRGALVLLSFGFIGVLLAGATFSTRCLRWFRDIPRIGPMFFDDVEQKRADNPRRGK